MINVTEAVKHLIIINVLFFIATQTFGDQRYQWFALWFPNNPNFRLWQMVTHMFMHGGMTHILFNMLGLWMFGSSVEAYLGKKQFLFLFFSAGLGAALFQLGYYYYNYLPLYSELINSGLTSDEIVQMLSSNQEIEGGISATQKLNLQYIYPVYDALMVGASGCIMGVLAAFGVMNPDAKLMMIFLPIPIKAKYFIPGIILLDIISAFTGQSFFSPSNTAYMAHVGGALIGFIMMWYWKNNSFNKNRWY